MTGVSGPSAMATQGRRGGGGAGVSSAATPQLQFAVIDVS